MALAARGSGHSIHAASIVKQPQKGIMKQACGRNFRPTAVDIANAIHRKSHWHISRHRERSASWIRKSAGDSIKAQAAFKFTAEDYHEVTFLPQPYGPIVLYNGSGIICLFKKSEGPFPSSGDTEILEVYVGGDVVESIKRLGMGFEAPEGAPEHRPLTHDFLWKVLEHFRQQYDSQWTLLRVAIVDAVNDVYLGRAFFGNALTGVVALDFDCRFSDACWLACKSRTPMYIHKKVWAEGKMTFYESAAYRIVQASPNHYVREDPVREDAWPEEVQLMSKQLEVAVKEEDYTVAIQLRDHPFMKLYNRIKKAEEEKFDTRRLREELESLIKKSREQRVAGDE